jgi:mannose-6-phosphate isomerase-like protein (cupin superfamily)
MMMSFSKKFNYTDEYSIEFHSKDNFIIRIKDEYMESKQGSDKPFTTETGEKVVEHSGLVADSNAERSVATAYFSSQGYSTLHFHKKSVEDYYIISGVAEVVINGESTKIESGGYIQIPPWKAHQVFNHSNTENS